MAEHLPRIWTNFKGDLLLEDDAQAHNERVVAHVIETLRAGNPAITEQEIEAVVARMQRQVAALAKMQSDLLIYGEATIDTGDFE